MNSVEVEITERFEQSFDHIIPILPKNLCTKLGRSIDNLMKMLSVFPESYPLLLSRKSCDIPFRKIVIDKKFIIIYIYQFEKVYLIDIFYAAQNYENKLIH